MKICQILTENASQQTNQQTTTPKTVLHIINKKRTNKSTAERELTLNEHLKVRNDANLRNFLKKNRKFLGKLQNQESRSEQLIEMNISKPIPSKAVLEKKKLVLYRRI